MARGAGMVRGERWRTAPGSESMVKGSARRRPVRDGAQRRVVRGESARRQATTDGMQRPMQFFT
eukprot:6038972-Pleurochrysis_carterae.AAC.1